MRNIKVALPNKEEKELLKLTRWEIMNIENEETFDLYERVFRMEYSLPEAGEDQTTTSLREEFKEKVMGSSIGKKGFYKTQKYLMQIADEGRVESKDRTQADEEEEEDEEDMIPQILIAASQHYSFPKSTSILGFGEEAVKKI